MHYELVDIVRQKLLEQDSPLAFDLMEMDEQSAARMLFINFRIYNGKPFGKRLTDTGLAQFKTLFKFWTIQCEEKFFTGAMRLFMDRWLKFPYYINGNNITLFEKAAVLEIKTAGNSITNWMNMHRDN